MILKENILVSIFVICFWILTYFTFFNKTNNQETFWWIDEELFTIERVDTFEVITEAWILLTEQKVFEVCTDMEELGMPNEERVCRITIESLTSPNDAISQNNLVSINRLANTIVWKSGAEYTYWYYYELQNWSFLYSFNTMYEFWSLITPDDFIRIH